VTEPCDLSAVEARALIGAKQLSASELLDSCIRRIESVDPAVNAMVARDFATARAAAREADAAVASGAALGPLHGLPLGVKDLEMTAGLRTTWGSQLFADHVPARDHGTVARARAAGAIVIGKTNVPEWGAGANTRNAVYGATGNPFDPSLSAAGSSGGSAVALATGMVPIATGSDLGGSLRNPAAFCGIVGFRPSPGLVPDETRAHGWSGLPVLGPMARTVPDLCLLLSVLAAHDPADPLSGPVDAAGLARPAPVDLASVRVALSPDLGFAPTERHIARVFADTTGLFRDVFARAEDTAPDCAGADEAFAVLRAVGMVAAHADKVARHPEKVGPNVRANVAEGMGYSAADVARAASLQTAMYHRWQDFFTRFDVLLTPGITISPRPWRELYPARIDGAPTLSYVHWLALSYAVTLVGHPAVCLPVGRDEAGLPFGIQIIGRRGGDAAVLAVAAALERRLAEDPRTARPVPDIAALAKAPPIAGMPGFMGFE
jgi:Asp-tRNA(Asn)/Glu-tRNA(Gln) amidotransferase A subunit family amidase